jgi:hypothetical protein
MTLTFDLDTDLAKRYLSYVSIIILSIINRDWPVLFIWIFKVLEQIWPLWPWPSRYQKNKKKTGLANVPLYPPTKFHSNIFSRFWETGRNMNSVMHARMDARTHARTHARTRVKIISCHCFAWQLKKRWNKPHNLFYRPS